MAHATDQHARDQHATDLQDRLDIADLLARYCLALDTRDWAGLEAVFTPDASCDYGTLGQPEGAAQIAALVSGTLRTLDATQHLIGNVQVEVSGDEASARCYLMAQHVRAGTPGGETYLMGGRYEDRVVRTPDGWRLAHRRLVRMWTTGNREVVQRASA